MTESTNLLTSTLASTWRGWQGIAARTDTDQPRQMLQLYEFENCPHCRIVREVLTELDLDAQIYPCPKGGERFRDQAMALGGKAQFPLLIDPNTGAEMYESMDIVGYLYQQYGNDDVPMRWRIVPLQKLSSYLASAARMTRGTYAVPSKPPELLLELYSFEGSPFARPVREVLCQMEIPYILRSCGRSEPGEWLPPKLRDALGIEPNSKLHNRVALLEKEGKQGIPYLYDPNTGEGLFESEAIIGYLEDTYARD
ncbi:MAG: glutathione S-transferase N-terminal domain-containing protein [Halieaceae bacterium]|nr:glutathione S-transferase N-terminal domain-containing protein [Halieaceae bacterium]